MNKEQARQLAELLARLVADGEITEDQAVQIYQATAGNAGLLDEALPLPPYEGIRKIAAEEDDDRPIWLLLAGALGLAAGAGLAAHVDRTSQLRRIGAVDTLQTQHSAQARALSNALARRQISVSAYQAGLRRLNNQHMSAAGALGAGTRYAATGAAIAEQATLQAAFLQRFADTIAGRILAAAAGLDALGDPFSAAYLAERAGQYGGIIRAIYFQMFELYRQIDDGTGWIVRYIARDDDRTCSPCHYAQGFYLPNTGPYPGQVCLGRHHCRCRRIVIYDPIRYAQLTSAGAPPP